MIKYFFIFTICVLINVTFGLQDDFTDHLWNKFKKTHGKHYLGDNLEAYRYGIFKSNLETIDKHNTEYSMGMHTYRLGINSFADWTFAEFKAKMLGTKLNMTHDKQASLGTFTKLTSTVKLPDEIDWRKEGAVTGVKNQGDCGSCWSFSSTGSLEGAHFRASGKLVSLSEQQLIDCSTSFQNDGCNGGLMDNAFEYLKSAGGIVSEQSYPYQAKQGVCHFNKKNIVTKCTGYVDIPQGDEDALKQAVATIGPVSVAIDVTQEKFMLYKDGIFVDDTCNNDQDSLNHGVLAVGYGKDAPTGLNRDEMNYWIVKNSWGPEWGEQGYIRMARNLNNMCGIASKASYPIVKN